MTDVSAAIGLAQLKRYDTDIIKKRKMLYELYKIQLSNNYFILPPFKEKEKENSFHLFPIRIKTFNETKRDDLIKKMKTAGISTNVHFIPLVMQPIYKNLGYTIKNYPNTYNMYKNEISLPLYSTLRKKDVIYICEKLKKSFLSITEKKL